MADVILLILPQFGLVKRSKEGKAEKYKVIEFAQHTKQYNDKFRGKYLILEPWQKHIFCNVYGWKRKEDGYRRFRKTYVQIGRKNGKSTMIAVLLLYDLLTTNGAQAYCACTKRDTAKGTATDDTFFCIMYCLDEKDKWTDESTYIKANPNMGVSMNAEFLHNLKVEAIQQPGLEGEFRTRNLGQWVSPINVWIPYQTWNNSVLNADKYSLSEEEKKRCLIIGAIDLSKRYDFSTYTKYFYSPKQNMFFAEHKMYFPEEQIDNKMKHDSPMIRKWIEQGYITPTAGSIVDYNAIFKDIKNDLEKYEVREVLYDPYNAATLMTEIGPYVDLVEVNQSMKNMSPMAKDWEAAICIHIV